MLLKLYVISSRESGYRETWDKPIAVFLSSVAPEVILTQNGSIHESKETFDSENIALRWWIQNSNSLNLVKDFVKLDKNTLS